MLSPAAAWPRPPRSVTVRPFSSEADQIANSPSGETQRGPPGASVTASSRASGSTGGSSSTIHMRRGYSGCLGRARQSHPADDGGPERKRRPIDREGPAASLPCRAMSVRRFDQDSDASAADAERLRLALTILEEIVADRALLGALPVEERTRLLRAAGDVYQPDLVQRR